MRARHLVPSLVLLAGALWSCLPTGGSAAESFRDGGAGAAPDRIEWIEAQPALLLDHRWLFRLADRSFREIPRPEAEPEAGWRASVSSDADRVLWFDGGRRVEVRSLSSSGALAAVVPNWIVGESEDPPVSGGTLRNQPFWGPDGRVFVQQYDLFDPGRVACGELEPNRSEWRRVSSMRCVESSFSAMTGVERVAPGRFAVTSSAEGAGAIDLVDLELRGDGTLASRLVLAVAGVEPAPLQLELGGGEPSIVFWCSLSARTLDAPRCVAGADPSGDEWAVYSVDEADRALVPRFEGLPRNLRIDPSAERMAWKRDGELCIRELAGESPECTKIPSGSPGSR